MSGPPYPRQNPAPGSNAIGTFQIGVSPLGTIPPFDFWVSVISQYANSPVITGMLESFNDAMDQTENLDNFYDMIWNIATAQGYGLDVWGRIVGVQRAVATVGSAAYFGFNEAGSWTGFGQGGFYSGSSITPNVILPDADFRRLILAKAAANISDGSIISINKILLALFPYRGAAYVVDNLNMTMVLKFAFQLTAVEKVIIQQPGVLPIPAGVAVSISTF